MQPNSEPSQADVAAVQAHLTGQPQAPAPEPAQPAPQPQQPAPQPQMQPAPVTPQPAPTSQPLDPFAAFMTPQPEPQAPPAPQPQQPTEPTPTPQPPITPTEPSQPAPENQPPAQPQPQAIPGQSPQGAEQYQSYEEYMNSITKGLGEIPAQPDPSKIDPEDPNAIKGFFDDLMTTAVARAEQSINRKAAIQNAERKLWDAAFDKYGSLRSNKKARDLVHSIRMGHFQRGQAITPTQAADILLDSMGQQYRQGVADNQVITTIEQVQPVGGNSGQQMPTTLDTQNDLIAVQNGGEVALAEILDAKIKAGQL